MTPRPILNLVLNLVQMYLHVLILVGTSTSKLTWSLTVPRYVVLSMYGFIPRSQFSYYLLNLVPVICILNLVVEVPGRSISMSISCMFHLRRVNTKLV